MQRAKNMMYATAGIQQAPGIAMNVRSHVVIPDAEAGNREQRSHYRAEETVERSRELTLSRNVAHAFWAILAAVMCLFVLCKHIQRNNLAADLKTARDKTIVQHEELAKLDEKLTKARDDNRIRYSASNDYHMVTAESVVSIPVTAPVTRYANNLTNGQTASSPLADGHGMIAGSR